MRNQEEGQAAQDVDENAQKGGKRPRLPLYFRNEILGVEIRIGDAQKDRRESSYRRRH